MKTLKMLLTKRGGGLSLSLIAILSSISTLKAIELNTICKSPDSECKIDATKLAGTTDIQNNNSTSLSKITIETQINNFTNNNNLSLSNDGKGITITTNGKIDNFINKDKISGGIFIQDVGNALTKITNYGEMQGVYAYKQQHITIDNRGIMKISNNTYFTNDGSKPAHFVFEDSNSKISIQNYKIKIIENASEFNAFTSYNDKTSNKNSHLIVWVHSNGKFVEFKDGQSKLLLDVGDGFEFGAAYKIAKLVTNQNGNAFNDLGLDFSRLALSDEIKDLYSLTNSGDSFIIRLLNKITETPITAIYKSNIRTMNNFHTISNSMIYPRKSYHSQNLRKSNLVILREQSDRRISNISSLRASEYERGNPFALSSLRDLPTANRGNLFIKESLDSALDSAIPLKSYESFSYRSEAQNRRIQRQNKRNYNRKTNNAESSVKSQGGLPRATSRARNDNSFIDSANETNKTNQHNLRDSANYSKSMRQTQNQQSSSLRASEYERGNPQNQNTSQNLAQNPHDYYFILTPFINHNLFFESGRYNLSGFDYGFLTAFSAQVAESNHLGTHFIFSYGKLGDSKDKDLSIKSLNLNIGLNYKLDLIYDMYLKARGDFFYFLNAIDSLTIKNIKPNNLGFGLSVTYGKDFDFKSGGVLGLEVGLDYKVLKTNEVLLNSQNYKQSLLNLIYADLGINYNKYFGGFGINLGTGFKANLAPKLAESALLINTQTLKFTLDNDKYLAYANAGISYMLNAKNFDMEFSLAYYGNYGDRVISNGGGVEWRTTW